MVDIFEKKLMLLSGKKNDKIKQIAAGSSTNWFLTESGKLYGMGYGYQGAQGNGSTSYVYQPTLRASNVKQVAVYGYQTWYVTKSGDLYGTGANNYGQQGSGDTTDVLTFTKRASDVDCIVEVYGTKVQYLDKNGNLYACGRVYGNTQVYTFTKCASNVAKVYNNFYIDKANNLYLFTDITTSNKLASNIKDFYNFTNNYWYISETGDLYGYGKNNSGQQGSGDYTEVTNFTKRASNVDFVAGYGYSQYSSSGYTYYGGISYINKSKDLYSSGHIPYNPSIWSSNVFTKRVSNVIYTIQNYNTAWYLTNDGTLYGGGYNNYGQQGSGNTTNVRGFAQRATNVAQIYSPLDSSGSNELTYYLTKSGDLYGCGNNSSGQIGVGSTDSKITTFTKISSNVVDVYISSNAFTLFYITEAGEIYVIGSYGQSSKRTPYKIELQ